MARRAWLRHPARTIRTPNCPTNLTRYTTIGHARAALLAGCTTTTLTSRPCDQCGGAHNTDTKEVP
ncbi:hypothetical protein [Streptomyces sp. NBC_00847]|uniref:hypothetical protein n=1 Tax=Streptomyces sp. NBC_00847 TaxID=2975850 RepID=UPI00225E5F47|nr:hypothetical protein [Streptomyces sp. NBC_00847]MCX4885911.1 hypothetical protein [Streptomyces sp. NBC_00847]